jgi:hypothetical protein
MSEWWSYSLTDLLLFSPRTYYRLFAIYNAAVWPAHVLALALGAVILLLIRRDERKQAHFIAAILAGCWLWVGWAYHWQRYATINWAATYFAVGFALEALLLTWVGVIRRGFAFPAHPHATNRIGLGMFVFALAVQPLIGLIAGRDWKQLELFGIAPDPTAAATLGILLAAGRVHFGLLIIHLLWCTIAGATLLTMGSPEALMMPVAAAITLLCSVVRSLRARRPK